MGGAGKPAPRAKSCREAQPLALSTTKEEDPSARAQRAESVYSTHREPNTLVVAMAPADAEGGKGDASPHEGAPLPRGLRGNTPLLRALGPKGPQVGVPGRMRPARGPADGVWAGEALREGVGLQDPPSPVRLQH